MRPEEIRTRETYRVREWDDLAAEFGVERMPNGLLLVNTPVPFPDTYRWICGSQFTVWRMERLGKKHQSATLCRSYEGVEVLRRGSGSVSIIAVTSEMLEELPTPVIPEIPFEFLLDYLFG